MPILARTPSPVSITGVRVYFEDIKRLYNTLDKANENKSPTVRILLRTAAQEHALAALDELKAYRPADLRYVSIGMAGVGGLTFHIIENRISIATSSPGAGDIADVVRDFERLDPPGRFAYLLRPKALNPYRVELLLNSRSEVSEHRSKARQFAITTAVGLGSMVGAFLALFPFK
ncbi:hypothetical protein ACIBI3_02285 [Actinomadura luteofluorescens]|uniref:hypothetical protein n=1 Tax=Actinomadura luteofluorescens TaxID=46163 RepID=UPI00347952C2